MGHQLDPEGPRITAVLGADGTRLGKVLKLSSTYRACRRSGTEQDMRRVADGFRSIESAVRWITQK